MGTEPSQGASDEMTPRTAEAIALATLPEPTPVAPATSVPAGRPEALAPPAQDPIARNLFEREKTCFEQNCDSFRSLNQLMWQVPLIAMSLTGGLWYGVSNSATPKMARLGLLLLAAIANAGLGGLVLPRVRNVMEAHLEKMKDFHVPGNPTPRDLTYLKWYGGSRGTMRVYATLLLLASAMSTIAWILVVSPPASVGTRSTGGTGIQGPTRWRADGSSPWWCRGGARFSAWAAPRRHAQDLEFAVRTERSRA